MSDPYQDKTFGDTAVGFGSRPAVIMVDFQKSFTEEKYTLGGSELVNNAVNTMSRVAATARRKQFPVIACGMAFHAANDMPRWKISGMYNGEFFFGHPAVELDPRIYEHDYDMRLYKIAPSMFFSTPLASFLTRHTIDTVIIGGCNTSGCVRATVIDSFSYGFRTIVVRDGCGDADIGPHEANLLDIERRYADVHPSDAVIDYLQAQKSGDYDPRFNLPQFI